MKQIFITSIIVAFMAMSQNAFSGRIIEANCPGMGPTCMQLEPNGTAEIKILVNPYLVNIQNTYWSVGLGTSENTWTSFQYPQDFVHEGGGIFSSTYFMPVNNNSSYNFILNLKDDKHNVKASWRPAGGRGFQVCQGNNRQSADLNLNLGTEKNISNEDLNSQSSIDNFDKYAVYPNPIEKDFTVAYQALQNEEVTLQIFDLKGKEIYTEKFIHQDNGLYSKQINNLSLLKGIYLCRIKTLNTEKTMKITKL